MELGSPVHGKAHIRESGGRGGGQSKPYHALRPGSKKLVLLSVNTLEKACGLPSKFICTVSMGIPGPELVRKKLLPGKEDICGVDCKGFNNFSDVSAGLLR